MSWNIMTSFNVVPFELYDEEHDVAVQRHNSNIGVGTLFFLCLADYFSKMNEMCCHGVLFLWQLRNLMNMRCLCNMVAMATFTRLLNKMSAKLMGMVCYYATRMNEPWMIVQTYFLKLFKCLLLNILHNVVRVLLSGGCPYKESLVYSVSGILFHLK